MSLPESTRDVRQALADAIDGQRLPNMKTFFSTLAEPVAGNDDTILFVNKGQTDHDGAESRWLAIIEDTIKRLNARLNDVAATNHQLTETNH